MNITGEDELLDQDSITMAFLMEKISEISEILKNTKQIPEKKNNFEVLKSFKIPSKE